MQFTTEEEIAASRARLNAMTGLLAEVEIHASRIFNETVAKAPAKRQRLIGVRSEVLKALTEAYALGLATGTSMAADAVEAAARGRQ